VPLDEIRRILRVSAIIKAKYNQFFKF
jgi:hypothetical protein